MQNINTKNNNNYICSNTCCESGLLDQTQLKQYAVGPDKDQYVLKFCGEYCWREFTSQMIYSYIKDPTLFPTKEYSKSFARVCKEWKKLGYMKEYARKFQEDARIYQIKLIKGHYNIPMEIEDENPKYILQLQN